MATTHTPWRYIESCDCDQCADERNERATAAAEAEYRRLVLNED